MEPDIRFLSTLPARGATHKVNDACNCREISIHAPREGSDALGRSERRVASISIHAPREGSDLDAWHYADHYEISIHAPREGSDDSMSGFKQAASTYFYPRSPRGERPDVADYGIHEQNFYPRSPRGERLFTNTAKKTKTVFLSTLPARGATYERV